ncbi:sulfatase-like hydrolase/transferase [Sinimarinibacterium thermocellulolyticum]|uniref:Sulfatase-like hydrolase/transferase n=1 Tax=Sinimarinibacterium thermocellulolyticum TaxID=3170016 RepID=A0ABV2A7J8_9GAMM
MKRTLLIALLVSAALAAALYVARVHILLHVTGWVSAIKHPVGSNREVPWQRGPDAPSRPPGARPPNIIVILFDDLGYNDVSTYGGGMPEVPTPNIDAVAAAGVRFRNGYAANAVCAPSRASLLTGRYHSRFGFEYTPTPGNMARVAPMLDTQRRRRLPTIVHPERAADIAGFDELGLPPAEITLAEMLKPAGYHNVHIGKWHLGGTDALRPLNQGFDESLYMENGLYLPVDHPEVVNSRQDFDPIDRFLWANMRYATSYNAGDWFEPRGYLTDYYTDEAIRVIEANRHRPFFLYLAHWAPHTPLQAAKADYDALAHIPDHRRRVYGAMLRAVDRSVGRVRAALQAQGLAEHTLLIVTSDNGAPNYLGLPDLNRPFRGWKLTLFEGGVRVPFVAQWPARIPAGIDFPHPVSSIDIVPTAVAAAGARLPEDRVIDGRDLLPYLRGEIEAPPHEALFWRDGSYQMVIARGWKLQVAKRPDKHWLFHLDVDPTEQHDLADRRPDKVAELRALLDAHNAQMAEPMWPSFVELPVLIDKTLAEPESPDDEYVYWQN